ncbi:hypothetical protein [Dinoroseobacter sp. S124A]|uniref:hypothetical protein n=1 Tax=Dinoroseobacter sp. S124A TaxID=3415128 RepID=UPI003C7A3AB5
MIRAIDVLAAGFLIFSAGNALAQQIVSDDDMATLDLSSIDRTIDQIASQVELLKGAGSGAASALGPAPTEPETTETVVYRTDRARSNALCFRDSDTGHDTLGALDGYFETVEALIGTVDTTVVAFDGLKGIHQQGSCPKFMRDMLTTLDRQLASVSRRDLSDLVFHLETCWPDEGATEADGSVLDMDARYARARTSLNSYRRSQRGFREAAAWCE